MGHCTITDEYTRKGIDVVLLESDVLRVEVLVGKGGDITEIRDKRTDVNVLFEAPHEWRAPGAGWANAPDATFSYMDHYPGGWQDVLPSAGGPTEVSGTTFALHGESPIVPWSVEEMRQDSDRTSVTMQVELGRYPLAVERTIELRSGDPTLRVEATVENVGEVPVHYSWLQHLAFGEPLISPQTTIDVPCETVRTDPEQPPTSTLTSDETASWPHVPTEEGTVDFRQCPPKEDRVHDLSALTGLKEGRYTITNPDIDLGVTVEFPEALFEYVWFWRAFGGFESAPFFGRNYNVGLEPSTSVPDSGLADAIENGTANRLTPRETVSASISVELHEANR